MIAALLLRMGLSQRVSGVLAWVLPIALFIVVCLSMLVLINRDANKRVDAAVKADQDAISLEAERLNRNRTEAADANMAAQAAQDQRNRDEIRDAVRNSSGEAVGPGVRDVLGELRRQQQAGKR